GPVANDRGLHWLVYGSCERIGASEAGKHIACSRCDARCRQCHLLALLRRSALLCLGAVRSPPDTSRPLSPVSEPVLAYVHVAHCPCLLSLSQTLRAF